MTDDGTSFSRNGIFGAIDGAKVAVNLVMISPNHAMIAADNVILARDMEIGTCKGFTLGVNNININGVAHFDGCRYRKESNCVNAGVVC
eukprot:scaffold578_cov167-Amphora_coffeaeformis.AAC.26